MKNILIAAMLVAGVAACNDSSNNNNMPNDSTDVNNRLEDTNLNRPIDSARQDTIRMDTTNMPKGGQDSIRQRY